MHYKEGRVQIVIYNRNINDYYVLNEIDKNNLELIWKGFNCC